MMKLNLLSLIVILNSLIHLSNQADFKDLKPFSCKDDKKYLDYFKNNKFIFTIKNDLVHLIFKNIQFAFKAPYFGDYDEDEQSEELIIGHPHVNRHGEIPNNFVRTDYLGIINNNDDIYLILKAKNDSDCLILKYFSGLIIQSNSEECFKIVKRISFEKIRGFNYYFSNNDLILFLSYSTRQKKIKIFRMVPTINNRNKSTLIRSQFEFGIDYKVKMAAISNVYSNESTIHYFNLYEIDENFTLHINHIKTAINNLSKIEEFKLEKKISLNESDFTNVIGCVDKITELNQIKGILFKDNKFYIISYRKYWIYETDLVKKNFNLTIENPKEYYFNFINENDLLTAEYEIRISKWIKQLDNEIYFIPYKNTIFEIKDSINNILELKKSNKELLNYCKGSTIKFNSDDYCFESTKYFKTKLFKDKNETVHQNKKYPISDLFKNTPYSYTNDDELLFIFKYANNSIVFLTIKSIIVIDINLFNRIQDYLQLESKSKVDNEFFVNENWLLNYLKSRSRSVSKETKSIFSLKSLIISLLFIVIIIFIFFFIKHKNKKLSDQKLNLKISPSKEKHTSPVNIKVKNIKDKQFK